MSPPVLAAAVLTLAFANPADRLRSQPLEPERSDRPERCLHKAQRGPEALALWLAQERRIGFSVGIESCRRVQHGDDGPLSLHAEGRALDWALNAHSPVERREADRLMSLFLRRDKRGQPHALARRMGIQELIFNCRYWGAGMAAPQKYGLCYDAAGQLEPDVDKTAAHMDHIHIGFNWPGARLKTSFWRATKLPRPLRSR